MMFLSCSSASSTRAWRGLVCSASGHREAASWQSGEDHRPGIDTRRVLHLGWCRSRSGCWGEPTVALNLLLVFEITLYDVFNYVIFSLCALRDPSSEPGAAKDLKFGGGFTWLGIRSVTDSDGRR